MRQMETGLRHRLRRAARQMAAQHKHLRTLHRALAQAVERGRIVEVRESVERLRSATEAHFSLEDGVFFPAVRGFRPEAARELRNLVREHGNYLADIARLSDALASGTLDAFAERYRALAESMADHEEREERLVATLADAFDANR
jgi:iron-sulfur cluster repair protein YtfE (RIC family)